MVRARGLDGAALAAEAAGRLPEVLRVRGGHGGILRLGAEARDAARVGRGGADVRGVDEQDQHLEGHQQRQPHEARRAQPRAHHVEHRHVVHQRHRHQAKQPAEEAAWIAVNEPVHLEGSQGLLNRDVTLVQELKST